VTVFNRLFIGLVALGVAVIVGGFALDTEAAVILVGLAILVAAVFTMLLATPVVTPSGQVSGEWVQLSFVHERFAAELDRFYGRSAVPMATGWNNSPTVKRWVLFVGGALILALLMGICLGGSDAPV